MNLRYIIIYLLAPTLERGYEMLEKPMHNFSYHMDRSSPKFLVGQQ